MIISISSLVKCSLRNQKYLIRYIGSANSKNYGLVNLICNCAATNSSHNNAYARSYSTQNENQPQQQEHQPANKLPPLMAFPKIVWPSLIKSLRNFILTTFIIKPYFDKDFSLQDFVYGSKKAVEVVSKTLAEGNLKQLEGLVTSDIIPTLQRSISAMSLAQRELIAIDVDDIYFSFPYQVQIGVIFDEEDQKEQKRFVEITMVYHALKGLAAMRSRGEEPPLNMGVLPEYQAKLSISNYRFVREYTKGVESDWTVNIVNHFKPDEP